MTKSISVSELKEVSQERNQLIADKTDLLRQLAKQEQRLRSYLDEQVRCAQVNVADISSRMHDDALKIESMCSRVDAFYPPELHLRRDELIRKIHEYHQSVSRLLDIKREDIKRF